MHTREMEGRKEGTEYFVAGDGASLCSYITTTNAEMAMEYPISSFPSWNRRFYKRNSQRGVHVQHYRDHRGKYGRRECGPKAPKS